MGSREGHDQAERAFTGPSRRFLVLFAETKSTSPAAMTRPRPPSPPQRAISPADPQALGSAGGPDDFILARRNESAGSVRRTRGGSLPLAYHKRCAGLRRGPR